MSKDFTPQELREVADYLKANTNLSPLAIEKIRNQAETVELREKQRLYLYKLATTFFNEYKTSNQTDFLRDYHTFDELPEWRQRPIMDSLQLALEENGYKKVNP